MSAHAPAHTVDHHPGASEYIRIALILTLITAVEVTVYYIHGLRAVLPPILLVLSALKFALVVMFYMHLKFDSKLFTGMFLFGMVTAAFTAVAFLALFGYVSAGGAGL